MSQANDKIKVIDCKASDHEYLHKDFHGALCYGIKYIEETYGSAAVTEYLEQVARTYFAPLSERLRKEGLSVLEEHFRRIFELEGGEAEFSYGADGSLTLEVKRCSAVEHLKKNNLFFTETYCQTTVVVNRTICRDAGYDSTCDYKPGEGRCVQRFFKKA